MKQTTQREVLRELEHAWKYMAPYKPDRVAARIIQIVDDETAALEARIKVLEQTLERERLKVAACGLAAAGNVEPDTGGVDITKYGSNALEKVMMLRRRCIKMERKMQCRM